MNSLEGLQALSKELSCSICLGVLKPPVARLGCCHYFCTPCITESLRSQSKCPLCKTACRRRDISRDEKMDRVALMYTELERASGEQLICTQLSSPLPMQRAATNMQPQGSPPVAAVLVEASAASPRPSQQPLLAGHSNEQGAPLQPAISPTSPQACNPIPEHCSPCHAAGAQTSQGHKAALEPETGLAPASTLLTPMQPGSVARPRGMRDGAPTSEGHAQVVSMPLPGQQQHQQQQDPFMDSVASPSWSPAVHIAGPSEAKRPCGSQHATSPVDVHEAEASMASKDADMPLAPAEMFQPAWMQQPHVQSAQEGRDRSDGSARLHQPSPRLLEGTDRMPAAAGRPADAAELGSVDLSMHSTLAETHGSPGVDAEQGPMGCLQESVSPVQGSFAEGQRQPLKPLPGFMPFSWLADVEEDAYATQQEMVSLTPLGSAPGTAPRSTRHQGLTPIQEVSPHPMTGLDPDCISPSGPARDLRRTVSLSDPALHFDGNSPGSDDRDAPAADVSSLDKRPEAYHIGGSQQRLALPTFADPELGLADSSTGADGMEAWNNSKAMQSGAPSQSIPMQHGLEADGQHAADSHPARDDGLLAGSGEMFSKPSGRSQQLLLGETVPQDSRKAEAALHPTEAQMFDAAEPLVMRPVGPVPASVSSPLRPPPQMVADTQVELSPSGQTEVEPGRQRALDNSAEAMAADSAGFLASAGSLLKSAGMPATLITTASQPDDQALAASVSRDVGTALHSTSGVVSEALLPTSLDSCAQLNGNDTATGHRVSNAGLEHGFGQESRHENGDAHAAKGFRNPQSGATTSSVQPQHGCTDAAARLSQSTIPQEGDGTFVTQTKGSAGARSEAKKGIKKGGSEMQQLSISAGSKMKPAKTPAGPSRLRQTTLQPGPGPRSAPPTISTKRRLSRDAAPASGGRRIPQRLQPWTCGTCTLHNPASAARCTLCLSWRPSSPNIAAPSAGSPVQGRGHVEVEEDAPQAISAADADSISALSSAGLLSQPSAEAALGEDKLQSARACLTACPMGLQNEFLPSNMAHSLDKMQAEENMRPGMPATAMSAEAPPTGESSEAPAIAAANDEQTAQPATGTATASGPQASILSHDAIPGRSLPIAGIESHSAATAAPQTGGVLLKEPTAAAPQAAPAFGMTSGPTVSLWPGAALPAAGPRVGGPAVAQPTAAVGTAPAAEQVAGPPTAKPGARKGKRRSSLGGFKAPRAEDVLVDAVAPSKVPVGGNVDAPVADTILDSQQLPVEANELHQHQLPGSASGHAQSLDDQIAEPVQHRQEESPLQQSHEGQQSSDQHSAETHPECAGKQLQKDEAGGAGNGSRTRRAAQNDMKQKQFNQKLPGAAVPASVCYDDPHLHGVQQSLEGQHTAAIGGSCQRGKGRSRRGSAAQPPAGAAESVKLGAEPQRQAETCRQQCTAREQQPDGGSNTAPQWPPQRASGRMTRPPHATCPSSKRGRSSGHIAMEPAPPTKRRRSDPGPSTQDDRPDADDKPAAVAGQHQAKGNKQKRKSVCAAELQPPHQDGDSMVNQAGANDCATQEPRERQLRRRSESMHAKTQTPHLDDVSVSKGAKASGACTEQPGRVCKQRQKSETVLAGKQASRKQQQQQLMAAPDGGSTDSLKADRPKVLQPRRSSGGVLKEMQPPQQQQQQPLHGPDASKHDESKSDQPKARKQRRRSESMLAEMKSQQQQQPEQGIGQQGKWARQHRQSGLDGQADSPSATIHGRQRKKPRASPLQRWQVRQPSWVLLGSGISAAERKLLEQLRDASSASLVSEWTSSVTHVVCGTSDNSRAKRTMKYLLGIASGKWVLGWAWLEACLEQGRAVAEEGFEIGEDTHGPTSGPILARLSRLEANPRLLSHWQVYLQPAQAEPCGRPSHTRPASNGRKPPGDLAFLVPLVEALGARLLPRAPAPTMGTRARCSNSTGAGAAAGPHSVIVTSKEHHGCNRPCGSSEDKSSQEEGRMVPVVSHQWLCDCAASFQVLPLEQFTC
ncbi:hypothetical protein WJX74_010361 [Apatococcus lobatus]|uniref:RanBP-type and C3HC4-type zinc finger-containing protein 1 n=1 Tax=Apatococcus lobatus TaxID=904363 RepID=A0AAW1RRC9_9CHLO